MYIIRLDKRCLSRLCISDQSLWGLSSPLLEHTISECFILWHMSSVTYQKSNWIEFGLREHFGPHVITDINEKANVVTMTSDVDVMTVFQTRQKDDPEMEKLNIVQSADKLIRDDIKSVLAWNESNMLRTVYTLDVNGTFQGMGIFANVILRTRKTTYQNKSRSKIRQLEERSLQMTLPWQVELTSNSKANARDWQH